MPDVTFSVGTRRYTLRCAPGQEDHLLQIAAALDGRVQPLAAGARGTDDRKVLVMAAIALVDELQAANRGASTPAGDAVAQQDNEALHAEIAALHADNAALREWAEDMAERLSQLSAALAALAEKPAAD